MVRQERREPIRKDKTPYKCDACDTIWVSQAALDNHILKTPQCVTESSIKVDKKMGEQDMRKKLDHRGGLNRLTAPSAKELKIDIARMISAQDGVAPEDRIMPRQGLMYVTPGMAQYWLAFNGNNVEPSYERVEEYAQEMSAGRWYNSRNPICFRDNGDLCSGQHRLLGHYYTNTGFEYQIELGVTEEEEAVIDIGRKRTIANFLSRGGKIENHRSVANAATLLWAHDEFAVPFNGTRTFRSRPVTVQGVILPFVRKHPEIEEAVKAVTNYYKPASRLLRGMGPAAAIYVLLSRSREHESRVLKFWSLLSSGEMLRVGSPIYALREQLINSASNPKARLDTIEVMAKTIKAYNDYVANRQRKSVIWRKDEIFPQVI